MILRNYKKIEGKLRKFLDYYLENKELEINEVHNIDACNSFSITGTINPFWPQEELRERLYDLLKVNFSKFFQWGSFTMVTESNEYGVLEQKIEKKTAKYYRSWKNLLELVNRETGEELGELDVSIRPDPSIGPDELVFGQVPSKDGLEKQIKEMMDFIFHDLVVKDELLFSIDGKNWEEHGSIPEFIEAQGLVDEGTIFWRKYNGKREKFEIVLEEIVDYECHAIPVK